MRLCQSCWLEFVFAIQRQTTVNQILANPIFRVFGVKMHFSQKKLSCLRISCSLKKRNVYNFTGDRPVKDSICSILSLNHSSSHPNCLLIQIWNLQVRTFNNRQMSNATRMQLPHSTINRVVAILIRRTINVVYSRIFDSSSKQFKTSSRKDCIDIHKITDIRDGEPKETYFRRYQIYANGMQFKYISSSSQIHLKFDRACGCWLNVKNYQKKHPRKKSSQRDNNQWL